MSNDQNEEIIDTVMVYENNAGDVFEGRSACEVVQAMYKCSKEVLSNLTFEGWCAYQERVFAVLNQGQGFGDLRAEEDAQSFLNQMVEVGDLKCGSGRVIDPASILPDLGF
ncbi:MAG: hypothetical protein ACLFP8_08645 [Alphaproteobacteria bacterium]